MCRLCSVLKCFMFLSFLSFMAYNIIGFPGISMGLFSEHGPCLEHDHELLRPIIVSTWMPEKVGGLPGKSLVFAESQVFFFSIKFLSINFISLFLNHYFETKFLCTFFLADRPRKHCHSGLELAFDVSE